MSLRDKFVEAYGIEYQEPDAISEKFVSDVQTVIKHLQDNCDFLTFRLSSMSGSASRILLICSDAEEPDERAVGISLSVGHDSAGQGVEFDGQHSEIYHIDSPEDLDYIAEAIVTKAGRDFAQTDMRNDNLSAMKSGFGLK